MRTLKEIISKLEILLQNERYSEALSVMNDFDPSLQNNEPHSPDRIDLLLMMVKIYLFNHLHEKAKECLSQLEGACKNIAADVEYINLKRQLLIVEGKIEEASSLLEEAAHNTLTKRQRHLITYYKGDIHFLKGEYIKASLCFQECYRYALMTGDTFLQGKTLYMLGYISFQRCFFDVATSYFEQSAAIFSALKNNYALGASYKMKGIIAYRTGEYERAKALLVRALRCFRRCSNLFGIINTTIAQSRVFLFQSDYTNAEHLLLKAYQSSKRIGYTRGLALAAEFLGEVHYNRGNYLESMAYLEESRQFANEIAPRGDIAVEVYRRLGDLYLATGESGKAKRVLVEALDLAEHLSDRYELGSILRAFGVLAYHKGDVALSKSYFNESIATLRLIKESFELARTYITAASLFSEWIETHINERKSNRDIAVAARDYATEATHLFLELGLDERAAESERLVHRLERIALVDDVAPGLQRLSFDQAWLFEETIVARSDHMLKVIAKAKQLAPRTIQVLITGETGTGKEVVARLLHRLSSRVSGPIIAVNCAALPEGVFESELFGHRRGAFTGADRDHAGLVERASGGTLFLDEISELTGHQQAKLLRVLQEGAIRRIGDTKERAVDVRVVTATNEDIETLLQSKRLREDFYYRIAAEHIELEPLRRRREDIIALFAYFLESEREGFRIEDGILELMERHHWPGNVRELENVTRVLAMLGGAERIIRIKDLSLKIRDFTAYERLNASRAGSYFMRENPLSRESCTGDPAGVCRLIASSLRRHDGNRSAAARELGVSRRTLYRRMAELGLLEE